MDSLPGNSEIPKRLDKLKTKRFPIVKKNLVRHSAQTFVDNKSSYVLPISMKISLGQAGSSPMICACEVFMADAQNLSSTPDRPLPQETNRLRIYFAAAAAVVLVAAAIFLQTFAASPLPMPAPYLGPLPSATPPKEIAVYAVFTGVNHRVAAFAYRGGSFFDRRDFSMAGTLVRHPRGNLLIDTGFGRHIDEQFRTLPLLFRTITLYSLWQPAADQLRDAGYDPKSLHAILLTHSHWDHVSGLPDFSGVPVWVTAQERAFMRKSGSMDFCKLFYRHSV